MSKEMFFTLISLTLGIAGAAVGIVRYRKLDAGLRWIMIACLSHLIVGSLYQYGLYWNRQILPVYTLATPFLASLTAGYLAIANPWLRRQRLWWIFPLGIFVMCSVFLARMKDIRMMDATSLVVCSVVFSLAALHALGLMVQQPNPLRRVHFWLCLVTLLFWSTSLSLWIAMERIYNNAPDCTSCQVLGNLRIALSILMDFVYLTALTLYPCAIKPQPLPMQSGTV
jgi:hypothetical protein